MLEPLGDAIMFRYNNGYKSRYSRSAIELGNKRLLDVAKACEETQCRNCFSMRTYGNEDCGSPACALGNYAVRDDLQSQFYLAPRDPDRGPDFRRDLAVWHKDESGEARIAHFDEDIVGDWFALDWEEAFELFGSTGCGGRSAGWYVDDVRQDDLDEGDDELAEARGAVELGMVCVTDPDAAAKYIRDFVERRTSAIESAESED